MKLKSNFAINLNFKPLVLWPESVPAVAMGGELLCGFQLPESHPVFMHEVGDATHNLSVFRSLYPSLSLPELARILKSSVFTHFFEARDFLKAYRLHDTPDLREILDSLVQLSADFQDFVSVKKMGPQELGSLTSLSLDLKKFVADELVKADDSKQDSVKRLELLSDLLQMGFSTENLTGLSLTDLSKKRYPVTNHRDEALSLTPLPWLSQVKAQVKRRGDKAGFEVQFFAGTPAELNKLAQNLGRVAEEWNAKS